MTKMRATVPFPFEENQALAKDVAMTLLGQSFVVTGMGKGTGTVVEVDWYSETNVMLVLEMEVNDGPPQKS